MTNDPTPTTRPTLPQLYQEVEAATSREEVFKILKKYKTYQDLETGVDRKRELDH
jgi:hypothetical protein